MVNICKNLHQIATYWAPLAENAYGKKTFDAPVFIACRWEDRIDLVMNKLGQEFTSKSRVFFSSALDINGYLFLGKSYEDDPLEVANAWEIQQLAVTPDLRNLTSLYTVYL